MNKILDNKKNKVSDALIENIEFSDKISLEQKIINLQAESEFLNSDLKLNFQEFKQIVN
ncbi:MAG: hypothetical protein KGO93_08930 [Cyanobacteria bacterium REEB446]|nr:hypothetical protein [Cyanobacteria bacterium REEB446]